jgi:hypothetical protein
MMKTKPIKTIDDLRRHQDLLKMKLESRAEQLSHSWTYARGNYKKLVWKEINPFKGNGALNIALDLIQPGLLPVIAEVAKGSVKGQPLNVKVLGSSLKYAAASLGIKWLRKWLEVKQDDSHEEANNQAEETHITAKEE